MIAYQNVEAECIRPHYMRGRYVPLPRIWGKYEACRGRYIQLLPCLTCFGSRLCNNPFPWWWLVFLRECVACPAAFLLLDFYDQYRLWFLPLRVRAGIRSLDRSLVLGIGGNYNELISLLDPTDQFNYNAVRIQWIRTQQVFNPADRSLGRRTPLAGDYVFYHPWEQNFISEVPATALRDGEHVIPLGHLRGYIMTDGFFNAHELLNPIVNDDTGLGRTIGGELLLLENAA